MHPSASTAGIVQHVITAVDGSRSRDPTNVVADDGPQRLPRSAADGHTTRISRTKNTESEVVTTENGFRLATSIDGTLTGRGGDVSSMIRSAFRTLSDSGQASSATGSATR